MAQSSWHLDKDPRAPAQGPSRCSSNKLSTPFSSSCGQGNVQFSSDLFSVILSTFSAPAVIVVPIVVSACLACLGWIQLAHSVAILISHSESMRIWVCVTDSNGISILRGPWAIALWLGQIHTCSSTRVRTHTLHSTQNKQQPHNKCCSPNATLYKSVARGKVLISQLRCHLPDVRLGKGHYCILLSFSVFAEYWSRRREGRRQRVYNRKSRLKMRNTSQCHDCLKQSLT